MGFYTSHDGVKIYFLVLATTVNPILKVLVNPCLECAMLRLEGLWN